MAVTRSELRLWPIFILIIGLIAGESSDVDCPAECECNTRNFEIFVDCSHRGLSEYPNFDNGSVTRMYRIKLSGNRFKEFPREYSSNIAIRTYLDLSDNYIDKLDVDALKGFTSLSILSLANNSITSWADINANVSFTHATGLRNLNISGNRLGTFGFDNELISGSLAELDISSAHINTVNLNWEDQLPNLFKLNMANNNLSQVRQLDLQNSLLVLNISNCSLQQIHLTSYHLTNLYLSNNPAIQFNSGDMQIYELTDLDLSYCNLDKIDLRNMPYLRKLRLRGNNLESINANTFANNPKINNLDLSENDLRLIESESFSSLKNLQYLNLANNKIVKFDENLISSNYILEYLDLSHNNIQKLPKIISKSLKFLDLSWCNITTIESSALSGLSAIEALDLSHNLISEISYQLESNTLQYLDLSYCRLSTIQINHFRGFPKLAVLHLNGNQLKSPIDPYYFRANNHLDKIWLADNPWICEGEYPLFLGFQKPHSGVGITVMDYHDLQCHSPSSNGIMLSILGISVFLLAIFILCCRYKRNQPKNRTDCDTNDEC